MTRVLIVDDNSESAYYLRALLEGHGWVAETASNGAEALLRARVITPDLVVSDLLMPVMDGYTLLRHWKEDRRFETVPFVVYTATYLDAADEELAQRMGADAFLVKPIEPDLLLARLEEQLSRTVNQQTEEPRVLLELHGQVLVQKLEQKMRELSAANRALEADIVARNAVETALRERTLEERAAQEKLRQSEALLRIAGRSARLGGWSLDVPEMTVDWSDEVCAIHELPAGTRPTLEQVLGYYASEFQQVIRGRIAACVEAGTPFDVELQIVTSQGRRVWVRAIGQAESGPDGVTRRVQGAFQNIDEQKKLAEQLRHAQKMEAIGQLAGGVAHDFNNLLSVILGYSAVVLDQLRPEDPLRADVQEIHRAGERATELTRQLLAFSRQQILQPRVLDLGQVLDGMERMLSRLLSDDIELSLIADGASHLVYADLTQLEQIVMNLVVNARDAMPLGGRLTLELRNAELAAGSGDTHEAVIPGPYVLLTVSDSGTGMDSATRERIFEPFFTTKDKSKGTGLGLATVFGIVKQSRGHIFVHTELGRGTRFEVYLPLTELELLPAPQLVPAATARRGSETVLLVEDEEQVRLMVRAILTRSGYHVLDAQNGGEAFLICEQYKSRIALLVTDLVMPRMSGKQLALRLAVLRPDMKVLFMSGYTENTLQHGVLDPDIAFLAKPITPDSLLKKVRETIDDVAHRLALAH